MCDYAADPIWCEPTGDNLALESLPLSAITKERLRAWADRYGEDDDDIKDLERFEAEGRALWALLRRELGDTWEVGYFSEGEQRRIWFGA